jgi:hypothetical protein
VNDSAEYGCTFERGECDDPFTIINKKIESSRGAQKCSKKPNNSIKCFSKTSFQSILESEREGRVSSSMST